MTSQTQLEDDVRKHYIQVRGTALSGVAAPDRVSTDGLDTYFSRWLDVYYSAIDMGVDRIIATQYADARVPYKEMYDISFELREWLPSLNGVDAIDTGYTSGQPIGLIIKEICPLLYDILEVVEEDMKVCPSLLALNSCKGLTGFFHFGSNQSASGLVSRYQWSGSKMQLKLYTGEED